MATSINLLMNSRFQVPRVVNHRVDSDPDSALRNAYRFLKHLPKVRFEDLAEDDRECGICQTSYGPDEDDEKVVVLPCGHKFGMDCIFQWLSPTNDPNRNTCPM